MYIATVKFEKKNGHLPKFYIYIQIDYNECEPESNIHIPDCGTEATCTNQVGTYSCQCNPGFVGTPPQCKGISTQIEVGFFPFNRGQLFRVSAKLAPSLA